MALEYLRQHWSEIVGGQIAGHAQPDQIRFHKLYLSIDTPPWMQELAFLKSTLLEKVNAALTEHDAGCSIQEIIFRLSSSPSSIPPPNQKRPNSGN